MSLKKKDPLQPGGLRVATDDPHLVSLGGGRLSTAVTIHHLPIGDMSIGSSVNCGVVLNGSGVQPHHCTLYRSESGEVTLVPERDSRILIDGKKISSEINLTQGAMLTIGKSNYLRFNNPAEAQMLKSSIGSNERISMPQIDFNQDSSSSNEGTPEDAMKNFIDIHTIPTTSYPNNNYSNNDKKMLEKVMKSSNDFTNINNFHSPKVFTADSITVNTPAKDVLGAKFNNFTKNLTQMFNKQTTTKPDLDIKTNQFQRNVNHTNENCVLTKVNNASANASPKLQPSSACYDRYPKPGSYGSLQVFPMNGINSEINNSDITVHNGDCSGASTSSPPPPSPQTELEIAAEVQRNRAKYERLQEEEISKMEQERLEEILRMCADFERQNQNIQSSPIVQNRIKTNGSLPRDKKSPYPTNHEHEQQNLFFPESPVKKSASGYENVKLVQGRRIEVSSLSPSPARRYENIAQPERHHNHNGNGLQQQQQQQHHQTNGQQCTENVAGKRYVPQSPRTKIRTCVSPKKESPTTKKTEYDLLVQSFEEKLRMEIQALRDNRNFENLTAAAVAVGIEPIYGTLDKRQRNVNNLTLTIGKEESNEKRLEELKKERTTVLANVRVLKTDISELQRQEEEILRELDMEKALVTAELATEQTQLLEMEKDMASLQTKIHRLEAQQNANRVMQETQQAKLKQSIDVKQDQVARLESLLEQIQSDQSIQDELNVTIDALENDKKIFEDLEFQYLEEETDWLGNREELHHKVKLLSRQIDDKRAHILRLENQGVDNQNTACLDTKNIEKNLWSMLSDMEKSREELKAIDKQIYDLSGQQHQNNNQSDSDDDDDDDDRYNNEQKRSTDIMSQSLFDSLDMPSTKSISNQCNNDIMSKSVNENLFFNTIEMPTKKLSINDGPQTTSTPMRNGVRQIIDVSEDITKISQNGHDQLKRAESNDSEVTAGSDESDPITKLKYNLSPPFEHKKRPASDECYHHIKSTNLNLSIESDDFEVNPLEKRVPSQDDIDRICKVTSDAPISTQGASDKVIESIKEIERNRQLLLAQQGSHVIEHERQKMSELKKKSHDEARAQYLQLQSISSDSSSESYLNKNRSLEQLEQPKTANNNKQQEPSPKKDAKSSPQRYSQPDFDRARPLSETNQEMSYDVITEKPFKSSIDIRLSSSPATNTHNYHHHRNQYDNNGDHNRNSQLSQSDTSESGRMISGNKRHLPKHQRPLTRYLPIMSSDLDLRQHIETAGHQVTLCPHVFVDSYSCRGYLHKLGATFHGWSRRWFVLDRQKMALIYYSDKSERKPRGGAYFSTIDEVYLDHMNTSKSGRPHCTFIVKTKKRSYHLQAASDAAARIWIDAIITGAQGNIDY